MDFIDLVAPGYPLSFLGSFLVVPWHQFGDHWIYLGRLGHFNFTQSRPECRLDSQGRPLKNLGQILEDVSLDFAAVVRF